MESASEPSIRASGFGVLAFVALVGAILLGAMFAGDASDVGGILPVGGAAVIALAASLLCVALARIPAPRVGRSGALVVGAAVALTIWIGITMWWSIAGDRSWEAFNKAVAYCAFLGLGVMLAAVGRRFGARLAASMLSVVIGATLVWALIAKAVPALDPEGDRVARLREPVGYWNALALLADIAIVLGLWLGTDARAPTRDSSRGCTSRLRRNARTASHALADGRRRRGRRGRRLARRRARAPGERAPARSRGRACDRGRRLGVHEARSHRGRGDALGSRQRRCGIRSTRPCRRARRHGARRLRPSEISRCVGASARRTKSDRARGGAGRGDGWCRGASPPRMPCPRGGTARRS